MIGDSQRRDRDGPTEFGIQGHFLNREGSGDFSSITDFAQMVINSLDV
jgi:FMN phosphatase YigB (HAD superfamily)